MILVRLTDWDCAGRTQQLGAVGIQKVITLSNIQFDQRQHSPVVSVVTVAGSLLSDNNPLFTTTMNIS